MSTVSAEQLEDKKLCATLHLKYLAQFHLVPNCAPYQFIVHSRDSLDLEEKVRINDPAYQVSQFLVLFGIR